VWESSSAPSGWQVQAEANQQTTFGAFWAKISVSAESNFTVYSQNNYHKMT